MKALRILIAEDETALCETIAKGLRMDGYAVDSCDNGETAWEMAFVETYDLIILDLNLPKMDGLDVLKEIRKTNQQVNILILSARSKVQDKIKGLDLGANDYLTKPFHFEELEARVRSLLRRKTLQHDTILQCGELCFHTISREAFISKNKLILTKKESGILEYLLLHQGSIVSQEELMEHVWDSNNDGFSSSVRVHIASLRKKIRAGLNYDPIENRIGEGYLICEKNM